ncbi:daunorubicin resistance protein DrrC [Candidatus Roizmanbacteria bacterium CG10_big_fil_rev_8_21_14_0_10_39_6]|uniref:UvrABC system protein A n=1 Tax=Candidatus Roizmanbacteria bacterium CG10_big_fil_rev_8_21_14_0_10_39_6 TaxID=1974853 RepID=A0A2M8KR52_9BACT|nr:MAG: daunorubicin resistance protein DrrC [Candidatus Roizmanbacteria bacterium CG10_big_fil_rev_8_21_14_0_10_39_6]
MKKIIIRGAKENNLKNIDLDIPRNKVVCFVGVSGSGKSTIAFDIIAREGERQYFESLPSYARRYLHKSNRPLVDEIKGVSASIVISQDRVRGNPRSTVGTLTEAYTYLRLLYSRVGLPSMDSSYYSFNHPYGACKKCKGLGRAVEVNISKVIDTNKSLNEGAIIPSDWYVGGRQWSIVKATGYFDMNKKLADYEAEDLDKILYAPPELLQSVSGEFIDRWTFQGVAHRIIHRNNNTHRSLSENDMRYFNLVDCSECHGGRLNSTSLDVLLHGKNIGEVANMPLEQCLSFVRSIDHKNAQVIKPRLIDQLQGLINVGVGYLSLNRSADTLSGGEAQRVKMARQLSCDLIETVYVLDEPTAGLHPRDVSHVVENLQRLRDNGNTVIVVEHDETVIRSADHIVEIGPGGGKNGGQIVASGTIDELIAHAHSLTGKYLNKSKYIGRKKEYRQSNNSLAVTGASRHNLKCIDVSIPMGVLVALTGVSGSGKSSLVEEIKSQHTNKIILIDQSSIGANRRGCIATYVGAFDYIRTCFANAHGLHPSLFSFNSHGGCELCKGVGYIDMDMNFLGDVKMKCESCSGSRYKEKVLRYTYKGKNIVEVLAMTALEIKQFFDSDNIHKPMNLLEEVGLDYIEMGQTLDTLSGGESQRLKLASKLQAKGEFYILDEPTSGLHFSDVEKLLALLNRLVDNGNTVLIIEHNLDLIKNADWVIDLGPEGGEKGGTVVAQGTPVEIARTVGSYTGTYLRDTLNM